MRCPSESTFSQAKRPCRAANNSLIDLRSRLVEAGCAQGCQGQPKPGVPRRTPRRAPRLCRVGRGRDLNETAAQSSVFFLPVGVEESERSGITLPDTRGWSTKSDRWKWGRAVPQGGELPARGFAQNETVRPHSALVTKNRCQTHAPQESVHVYLTRSTTDSAQCCARASATARHTHVVSLTHSRSDLPLWSQ